MRVILILFIIHIQTAQAQPREPQPQIQMGMPQAMAETQKAILAYPYVKSKVKQLERKLIHYIPVEKEYIIFTGTIGMAIVRGRIESKPIKNLSTDFLGGRARPDVFYNLKDKEAGANLSITWGF